MIDATGAIYVIGGYNTKQSPDVYFNDVWASTDGGVHRTRSGCPRGVLRRYYRSTWGTIGGTAGVLQGVRGGLGCTRGLSKRTRGVHGGCHEVLEGYSVYYSQVF